MVACVTYGAPVCHKAGASMFCHKKLLSIQRVFMLASLPVCRATDSLQELLGAMPLNLDVKSRVILHKLERNLQLAEDKDWLSPSDLVDEDVRRYKALLRECLLIGESQGGRTATSYSRRNVRIGTGQNFTSAYVSNQRDEVLSMYFYIRNFLPRRKAVTTRSLANRGITYGGSGWDFSRVLKDD